MNLIVVTDIFGRTRYIDELLNDLSSKYFSTQVLDPYDGKEIHFKNEETAYNHFQKTMGLDKYSEYLFQKLNDKEDSQQIVLGFSIGASALWAISDRLKLYKKTKGICFYSSQVRNYLYVNPKIKIDFYFAKYESSYDISDVSRKLSKKAKVNCYNTEYLHGFMNKKSMHYNKQGYGDYLKHLNLESI